MATINNFTVTTKATQDMSTSTAPKPLTPLIIPKRKIITIDQNLSENDRFLFTSLCDCVCSPQGTDFIPKIEQRRVKPASYRRGFKSIPNSCYADEMKKRSPNNKGKAIIIDQKRKEKYAPIFEPQMNIFNSAVRVEFNSEMEEAISDLSKSLKTGINVSHNLDPSVLAAVANVTSAMEKGTSIDVKFDSGISSKIVLLLVAIAAGVIHWKKPSLSSMAVLITTISAGVLTQSFMSLEGMSDLLLYFGNYVKTFNEVQPQMSSDDLANIVSSLTMILIGVVSGTSTKKPWHSTIIDHVFNYKKHCDSLEACATSLVKIIENIVNFIRRDCLGINSLSFLETGRDDIDSFLARVRVVSDAIATNKYAFTPNNAETIHSLWQEVETILVKLPRNTPTGIMAALGNAKHFLTTTKKTFDGLNLTFEGSRIEPVAVVFRGAPGVGKSNMLEHLAYAYLSRTLPEEKQEQFKTNPKTFIYNRQAENVYWDGYHSDKRVAFIDDLGQMRDVAGQPDNEYMNWIRMVSVFEYVLHMASIEKKGNVRFVSRAVFVNTNMTVIRQESIKEFEAFKRRADFVYDVVPREEFCKKESLGGVLRDRRIDATKLPIGSLGISQLTPDICEFHEIDWMSNEMGEATGRILNFDEVLKEILIRHDVKEQRYNQYKVDLSATAAKYAMPTEIKSKSLEPQAGHSDFCPVRNPRFITFLEADVPQWEDRLAYLYSKFHTNYNYTPTVEALLEYFVHRYGNEFMDIVSRPMSEFYYFFEEGEETALQNGWHHNVSDKKGVLNSLISAFENGYKEIDIFLSKLSIPALHIGPREIKQIGSAISLALLSYGFIKITGVDRMIWQWYKRTFVSTINDFEAEYSGKPQRDRTGREKKNPRSLKDIRSRVATLQPAVYAQAAHKYDLANVSIVDKVIYRNCYELFLPDQENRLGFITFVRGTVFMMPRHFLTKMDAIMEDYPEYCDKLVTFKKTGSTSTMAYRMADMCDVVSSTELEALDVVFIRLPRHCPPHCDITKFFPSRAEIDTYKDLNFRLVMPGVKLVESWMGKALPVTAEFITAEDSYTLAKGFKYQALTKNGDCGALFTLVDTHSAFKKILGIHVAGSPSTGVGVSTCLTREDVLDGLKETDEIITHFETELYAQASDVVLDGRFQTDYRHEYRVPSGGITKIMKSPLHGAWGAALTLPAKLLPFTYNLQRVEPYQNALKNYCTPFVHIDAHIFHAIGNMMYDHLCAISEINVPKVVLSFEEAILGIPGEPDFDSISRATSAGFPHNAMPGKKYPGKVKFFGNGQEFDLTKEEAIKLKAEVLEIIDDASKSVRREHIYTDCLKDERRPIEKVFAGKTRLFSCSPVGLLVAFRMLFGSYVLWCHKNYLTNGFNVGNNPYSFDWHNLATKLLRFGDNHPNIGAGDYSKFDGSEKPVIHYAILDVINRWYRDGNDRAREVLWLEIVNSKHIYGSLVYEWMSSLPSGAPVTTLVNNHYNHMAAIYVWYKNHDFNVKDLYDFYKYVVYETLGDDNVFAVHPKKLDKFNEIRLSEDLVDLGMTYTNELKGESNVVMRKITEVSFLKRSFRYEKIYDRYCGPLALEVILEIPYWTKECSNPMTIVDDNVNLSLRELALHDPRVWEKWAPQIIDAYSMRCNKSPKCTSRLALLRIVEDAEDWF